MITKRILKHKILIMVLAQLLLGVSFCAASVNGKEVGFNAWIDIPIVEVLEYFGGIMAVAYGWMRSTGMIFGLLGIVWSGFRVMMSRMTVKDLWWDTCFKWTGFFLLVALYPSISFGVIKLANEIGMKAGAGETVIKDGLKQLHASIERDVQTQQQLLDGNLSLKEVADYALNGTEGLTLTQEFDNNAKYREFMGKYDDAYVFSSTKDKKGAAEVAHDVKQDNKFQSVFSSVTLQVLNSILDVPDLDGNKSGADKYKYASLKLYLKDINGDDTCFLSPSAMLKLAIFSGLVMVQKQDAQYAEAVEAVKNDNSGFAYIGARVSLSMENLFQKVVTFFCAVVLILATIFSTIQYVMTIIEFIIISGIGAIFIPLLLFDGTKDIPKKLIPVFTSFFVKILVIQICIMFVYYLLLENCINTIGDDGGFNLIAVAEILFDATLAYILTQNAPKIAQTILTGQPQLSMGEFVAGAGTAMATAATMKQAPHAATMAAAKGKAKINDIGGAVRKNNAASKAAVASLGANATGFQKLRAGISARGAVATQDLKDKMHAKFEAAGKEGGSGFSVADKINQQFGFTKAGGSGGGVGGSSSAYGQTGQTKGGAFLNASSNPNFSTATKTDKKTGQQRSMTKKEFDAEKRLQGANVGAKVGNRMREKIDAQNAKKAEQGGALPENLSGNERSYNE